MKLDISYSNLLELAQIIESRMKLKNRHFAILLIVGLVSFHYPPMGSILASRQPPTITAIGANPNPSSHGDTVNLYVQVSSKDKGNFTYSWSEYGPLVVSLSGADTASPSFVAPHLERDTNVTFSVTVSDGNGRASSMNITAIIKSFSGRLAIVNSV
jgi:hypothetical protein